MLKGGELDRLVCHFLLQPYFFIQKLPDLPVRELTVIMTIQL